MLAEGQRAPAGKEEASVDVRDRLGSSQRHVVCEFPAERRIGAPQCVRILDDVAHAQVADEQDGRFATVEDLRLEVRFALDDADGRGVEPIELLFPSPDDDGVNRERLVRRIELDVDLRRRLEPHLVEDLARPVDVRLDRAARDIDLTIVEKVAPSVRDLVAIGRRRHLAGRHRADRRDPTRERPHAPTFRPVRTRRAWRAGDEQDEQDEQDDAREAKPERAAESVSPHHSRPTA